MTQSDESFETINPFTLRHSQGLKSTLKQMAKSWKHSFNTTVILLLEHSFTTQKVYAKIDVPDGIGLPCKVGIRLPLELRAKILNSISLSGLSLNSEILARLESAIQNAPVISGVLPTRVLCDDQTLAWNTLNAAIRAVVNGSALTLSSGLNELEAARLNYEQLLSRNAD